MKSKKIGLMGGSFSPFHLAHLNSLIGIHEKFDLETICLFLPIKPLLKEKTRFQPLIDSIC